MAKTVQLFLEEGKRIDGIEWKKKKDSTFACINRSYSGSSTTDSELTISSRRLCSYRK